MSTGRRVPRATLRLRAGDVQPSAMQPGGVPIVIGGYALATARRAGRIGDGSLSGACVGE